MAADPNQVRVMADHSVAAAHPSVFDRFGFLTGTTRTRTFAEMAATAGFGSADLRDDVTEMVDRYVGAGLDVIVVDQTTPEHRAGGFVCVKAIVPGTLPMTFGHGYRRIDGLPRLYDVPRRLGYYDRPLRRGEVNPHPHPFP
jgi:ribosomal protein S12 methylthiotransferase accessory factor